jgi:glucokinase
MKKFIGIDLGGTNLRAGIVDLESGTVLKIKSVPTLAREGHDAVMARMADLVKSVIAENDLVKADVGGVGIGVPGVLDLEKGTVVFLPNLPGRWENVTLRDTVANQTGLPVSLLNDARAITFGEWKFGAGRGVETMACFTIGTGVGGGLVINGRLHMGIGGTAGELGHQTVDPSGVRCGCGNIGCLETVGSASAIAAMGMKAVVQGLTTRIGELCGHDLNKITTELIARAANEGDTVAREIFNRAGNAFGIAIANILVTIGPRRVVLGGGGAAAGELLFDPIRRVIKERVTIMPADQVEIVAAQLGNNAGVLGTAQWTYQNLSGG